MMRSAIKNICIKTVSVFVLLFGFIFSLSAFGMIGNLFTCGAGNDQKSYDANHEYLKKFPNDVMMIYGLGIDALCIGKTDEGMEHVENASDGGHIMASRIMALYYRTDGTFNSSQFTEDPENFDKMLFYYERTAKLIESNNSYPEGTTDDMPYLEEQGRISARIFTALPRSYYYGYGMALEDILRSEVDVTDTEKVLRRMQNAAERCLERPALSVWNDDKDMIAKALQLRCQAMKDFASGALDLETTRIVLAKQCAVPLGECPEHQNIINELVALANVMWAQLDEAPVISGIPSF